MSIKVDNGQAAETAPQLPPWMTVDPEAMIRQLTLQLAGQAQEMAAMRIYIDQLHQALQDAAGTVPAAEDPAS